MTYYPFKDEDGNEHGSFEVYEMDQQDCDEQNAEMAEFGYDKDDYFQPGWYWRACFPGCLPDGDPSGPFDSEEEAIQDAQES